jgi:hypothetical protein
VEVEVEVGDGVAVGVAEVAIALPRTRNPRDLWRACVTTGVNLPGHAPVITRANVE